MEKRGEGDFRSNVNSTMRPLIIAEGTTTDETVKMFGEPQHKENLPSGETKYVYYYRTSQDVLFFPKKADPQDQQRPEVFLKSNQV